eukprot:COSAG02_NODE_32822_length_510_cov_0.564477_1_plen_49_part_10
MNSTRLDNDTALSPSSAAVAVRSIGITSARWLSSNIASCLPQRDAEQDS